MQPTGAFGPHGGDHQCLWLETEGGIVVQGQDCGAVSIDIGEYAMCG